MPCKPVKVAQQGAAMPCSQLGVNAFHGVQRQRAAYAYSVSQSGIELQD